MSLLLADGTVVVSLDPPLVGSADVLVADGRISGVGGDEVDRTRADITETIDAGGCLVVPGNVDAHTHLYAALARGMPYRLPPPRDFLEILQRVWWRLDRALDPASIRASVLVAGAEALRTGTTTLIDHHASPNAIDGSLDLVAEALAELGVRSVCCYEVSDRDGAASAMAGIAENRRFLARAGAGELPLARGLAGAHASFTVSPETLSGCVEVARDAGVGLHVHVAEEALDEADAERRYGKRVLRRLADAGALDERALLAHGVHLDDAEVGLLEEVGATLAHCPRSNMNNGVGRAPLARLADRARVALGTDGIGADMFAESERAYVRAREEGAVGSTRWPLALLAQGARVAGQAFDEPLLGRLEPGAPADLVVLDYAAPTPVDASTLAGHWVFGLHARHVRDVVVAGRVVVRQRRLTLADEEEIAARAREVTAPLWERLASIDAHPFEPREA